MSKMKYAFAMLAAGGAVGAASEAAASTTITFTDPLSASASPVDIFLVTGAPAQYFYGAKQDFGSQLGVYADAYTGIVTTDPALPTSDEVFTNAPVKTTGLIPPTPVGPGGSFALTDTYVHLAFTAGGDNFLGAAHLNGNSAIDEITYEQGDFSVAGVPEPAAWALMIGGFGLAGAALRQRRRAQLALSA